MTDEARDFDFFGAFYVKGCVEGHVEVTFFVGGKHSHEGLFEDGGCEGVGEDEMASCGVGEGSHLQETYLI